EGARAGARASGAMPPAAALAGAAASAAAPLGDATARYAAPVAPPSSGDPYARAAAPVAIPPANAGQVPAARAAADHGPGRFDDGEEDARRRRRRVIWAGLAVLLLFCGAAAAAIVLSSSTAEVTVPALVGQPEAGAAKAVRALHLVPVAVPAPSETFPPGVVSAQRPAAGSVVTQGSRIYLSVSTGAGTVVVPKVAGLPEPRAKQLLLAAGLNPAVQPQASGTVKPGIALSTNPPYGVDAQRGTTVTLFVSSGPAGRGSSQSAVPDVTGLSQRSATEAIEAAGFRVGVLTRRPSPSQPAGTVISQLPVGGASLSRGGSVDIVIAEAPATVTVPNVIGRSQTAAAAALGAAGLTPTSTQQTVSNQGEAGIVLEQTPPAGRRVRRGANVTIIVGAITQSQTTTTAIASPEAPGG
ncbi:MAG: PASTA domain-containing protein, partial [Acidobacteriota bacterium]|nr:PASTA domain-containing protein [Acidobacteriota bacterium]